MSSHPIEAARRRVVASWHLHRADLVATAYAAALWVAALIGFDLPVLVAAFGVLTAIALRRRTMLALAIVVLVAGRAHEARAALVAPPEGRITSSVRLVTDPDQIGTTWRAYASSEHGRVLLTANGTGGRSLSTMTAGEGAVVAGTLRQLTHPERYLWRHVRAQITIDSISPVRGGGPLVEAVNALRGVVQRSAEPLPVEQRSVYLGFVLGDDRGRSASVTEDFERSGLAHLLVVSGENLAFVLLVLGPVLRRGGRWWRWLLTISVLALFVAITRAEPSVLRASAMVAVAATAIVLGRPMRVQRLVAFGVVALLIIDPLLVHSMGFAMSVAASAGIVWLTPWLSRRIPGPNWLRLAVAVTIAAQVAVAPLVIPIFGPMPVASLPANVLAEPFAAFVMMWGCTAGLVAGVVGGPIATVLQLPTRLALWWVMTVAHLGARLPLGHIG